MNHIIDSNTANATLHRLNALAKVRRLAVNQILRDSRNASSLDALRTLIEQTIAELDQREQNAISHT